ncbi:MAG: RES family NAD+ phosphorylase [Actinomycetota bacterium]
MPERRPVGLRLRIVETSWWRIDAAAPQDWDWRPFPEPRHRFDSASGSFRVRYAARTERAAYRERFADEGRRISAAHATDHLVEIHGRLRVLDLRNEQTLDALNLDDEANVGRAARVLQATQLLSDRLVGWYADDLHGLLYRSRTTPSASPNLAFFAAAPVTTIDHGKLQDQTATLARLILRERFAVEFPLR